MKHESFVHLLVIFDITCVSEKMQLLVLKTGDILFANKILADCVFFTWHDLQTIRDQSS